MEVTFHPFEERIIPDLWKEKAKPISDYWQFYQQYADKPEKIWEEEAKELDWFKPWDKVVEARPLVKNWREIVHKDYPEPPFYYWFVGGELNMCYLCLDRHIKTHRKNKVAFIWEGEPVDEAGEPKEVKKLTYYDLYREVNRLSYVLREKFGLKRGDPVGIYMPMIPESIIVMLAVARLGLPFTLVFSGFTADAVADRFGDLGVKMVFTTDGLYRRGRILNLKEIIDRALERVPTCEKILVVRRTGSPVNMVEGRDYWWHDVLKDVPVNVYVEPESMRSEDTLYVLYTSGTTAKPKGAIHDTGGYATILHATMKWIFDIKDEDIYWCTADIGWVTGHSYIIYGPLMAGATGVMYEGAPDFPAPDRWWRIIDRYGVSILYTSPTAIRALMKFPEEMVKKHDLSTLRICHSVGEPINPEAWRWYYDVVGKGRGVYIASTWWMTETGGILISHAPGLMPIPVKPGTNGPPLPGIIAEVVDESGNPVPPGTKGYLIIKKPWPGMFPSMFKEEERFLKVYYSRFPGFEVGDFAIKDSDGFIWVLGRADDVLKVSGHRIGTAELEEVISRHKAVAESAVIGTPDPVKGEVPLAFVVLKSGYKGSVELTKEIKDHIRAVYGPIAEPKAVYFVSLLPKTRSGKIMRRLVKAVAAGKSLGDVTALETDVAVEEVKTAFEEFGKALKEAGII